MKLVARSAREARSRHSLPSHPLMCPGFSTRQAAFSLTEVVLALGVAAVALTSIMGLFPVGLNMSKESFESTQAALIAQTIMADLKDQQTGNGNKRTAKAPYNTKLLQIAPNSDPATVSSNYVVLPLDVISTVTAYVAYKPFVGPGNDTDANNPPMLRPAAYSVAATPPDWYTTNNQTNGFSVIVKVTLSPTLRFGSATTTSGPRRVDISVETPGNVAETNRTCFLFTGVIRP